MQEILTRCFYFLMLLLQCLHAKFSTWMYWPHVVHWFVWWSLLLKDLPQILQVCCFTLVWSSPIWSVTLSSLAIDKLLLNGEHFTAMFTVESFAQMSCLDVWWKGNFSRKAFISFYMWTSQLESSVECTDPQTTP